MAPRSLFRRLAPLLVLALLGVAYWGFARYKAAQPLEWSGTVEARTIEVGSRTGGRVKDVLVREGERVAAGQPVVMLEAGDLEAQRLMARAQLQQAEAALAKLEKGARPEEIAQARARAEGAFAALQQSRAGARSEELDAARARLASAEAALDKARLDAERASRLVESGAISRADADSAETQLRAATAQRDALASSLKELENGTRSEELQQAASRAAEARAQAQLVAGAARVEDVESARAVVEAARGRLQQIEVSLEELTVRAPRPTRVETIDLRPGDLLAPNATAAILVEDDQLYVRIYVPETQLGLVHTGQKLPVFVDSFPGRPFEGVVQHVNTVGEYSPRNLQTADERADQVFATRLDLTSGRETLRAGMAALVKVPRAGGT